MRRASLVPADVRGGFTPACFAVKFIQMSYVLPPVSTTGHDQNNPRWCQWSAGKSSNMETPPGV